MSPHGFMYPFSNSWLIYRIISRSILQLHPFLSRFPQHFQYSSISRIPPPRFTYTFTKTYCVSFAVCLCVCVCVCSHAHAHAHAYARICVDARSVGELKARGCLRNCRARLYQCVKIITYNVRTYISLWACTSTWSLYIEMSSRMSKRFRFLLFVCFFWGGNFLYMQT